MESGSYQELKSNGNNSRLVAILIAAVTIMLCLLVGLGTWILISDSTASPIAVEEGKNIVEEVVIIEDVVPSAQVVEVQPEIKIIAENPVESAIYEEVQDVIKQEEEQQTEVFGQVVDPEEMPFLHSLVRFSNDIASQVLGQLAENDRFAAIFNQPEGESHSRQRRSISAIGGTALKYLSYASFGRFMFREVKDITEYAVEGRKLNGDSDAMFLDGDYWNTFADKPTNEVVEKIDTGVTSAEFSNDKIKKNRPPTAFDDGWTPMVNKVSLKFITDMLTTLLNLMREYLMKDHVMECLWFMFCKDMNHQAKYNDPMGYLARVNSVGLKVLVDREGREVDTVTSVWQALTKWEPLICDQMFPKCDGTKALEIVNEVANASRR